MKCICGYEYGATYNGDGKQILIGDIEFEIAEESIYLKIGTAYVKKSIFICPKCGTLKIDI